MIACAPLPAHFGASVAEVARAEPPALPIPHDGLALTPPLGWNSWNTFDCGVNAEVVKGQAEALVSSGLRDRGFRYVVVDDCWQAPTRDSEGRLRPDPARFPEGMEALGRYLHERGLAFGMYSSPGPLTCQKRPGSEGHEEIDAATFASWGVDYLKYDRCSAPKEGLHGRFARMRAALRATGRPVVFSVNPDRAPETRPWSEVAHMWRTTPDIKPTWTIRAFPSFRGIIDIADINHDRHGLARPGAWNDPDMLEVGVRGIPWFGPVKWPGLSDDEARSHLSLWAMMAAPLMAGNDLRTMDEATLALLGHDGILAIDQDPLGVQGRRVRDEGDVEVWTKPLAGGEWAVLLLNRSPWPRRIAVESNEFAPDAHVGVEFEWTDVWEREELGSSTSREARVPPRGAVVLRARRVAGR